MYSRWKAIGLALFAVFAMSAVASASASAVIDHITSDSETEVTHLTAKATGPQVFRATTEETNSVVCEEVNVHGTIEGNTTDKVTVTPTFGQQNDDCTAFSPEPLKATVTTNNCHFLFTGETTETVTPGEHATVHLLGCEKDPNHPEEPKGILIDVTQFTLPCILIPEEQSLHGIRYSNDGENTNAIEIEATVHGIHSTTTGACGEETHTDGSYTGNVTVTGYEDEAHEKEVNLDVVASNTPAE